MCRSVKQQKNMLIMHVDCKMHWGPFRKTEVALYQCSELVLSCNEVMPMVMHMILQKRWCEWGLKDEKRKCSFKVYSFCVCIRVSSLARQWL